MYAIIPYINYAITIPLFPSLGTLMECYIHPAVPYTSQSGVLQKQRGFLLKQLHRHLQQQQALAYDPAHNNNKRPFSVLDCGGVCEGGWTAQSLYRGSTERDRGGHQQKLLPLLRSALDKVRAHKYASLLAEE
ncbi:hypothetical protein EON64_18365, partial [archaeon]